MSKLLDPFTSSKSMEWFTPPEVIEVVTKVLDGITLDPAGCMYANTIVNAHAIYTKEDNGLVNPWWGTVFLNPPYGFTSNKKSMAGVWAETMIRKYCRQEFTSGILLLNANVSDKWFENLRKFPMVFSKRRIKFLDANGVRQKSPSHGNVLIYFGDNPDTFYKETRELFWTPNA